jgi:hypothetical protein
MIRRAEMPLNRYFYIMGDSVEKIIAVTGLSIDKIEKLKQ